MLWGALCSEKSECKKNNALHNRNLSRKILISSTNTVTMLGGVEIGKGLNHSTKENKSKPNIHTYD